MNDFLLRRRKHPIDRGYDWERQFFGLSSEVSAVQVRLERDEAIQDAISRQDELGWNPDRPKTDVAFELLECARSYLPPAWKSELRLYCALGLSADQNHDIDGFFMIKDVVVTVDLVLSTSQTSRADILASKLQDNRKLWRVGYQVAQMILMGNDTTLV